MTQLSVIIPTYNRATVLDWCLHALEGQTLPLSSFEVLVVDDGSSDDTAQVVERHRSRLQLRYFRLDHRGAPAARNVGIRESRSELLVFLDSDSLASPELLAEHMAFHEAHPRSVVTGPALLVHSPRHRRRWLWPWDFSTAPFAGGNASVRRCDAIAAGMFDEGFPELGWEDIEFGLRLKQLGLKVRFNPRAVVYHYKPLDVNPDALARYAQQQGRMAVYFYRKHPVAEVAFATGLNPLALVMDRLASVGDWNLRLARWLLDVGRRRRVAALVRFGGRYLYNRHYFKALRQALAAQAASAPGPG